MENNYQTYKSLLENYTSSYIGEYGSKSAMKTIRTIQNSKHSINLLHQSASKGFVPTVKDFNTFVLSNLSMSFAKTEKVKFASIILFNHWHNDVNVELELASEEQVIHIFNSILKYTI